METVTLELPESVVHTARQVAEATNQPLDLVLQVSITHALPPLDDVPPEEAATLASLALQDDGTLWRIARSTMLDSEQEELHDLLDRQGAGQLAAGDLERLRALMKIYGELLVQQAHAYLLLARRGYRVPMQTSRE